MDLEIDKLKHAKYTYAVKALGLLEGMLNNGQIPAMHIETAQSFISGYDAADKILSDALESRIAASKADYLANPPSWDAWMNEPKPF